VQGYDTRLWALPQSFFLAVSIDTHEVAAYFRALSNTPAGVHFVELLLHGHHAPLHCLESYTPHQVVPALPQSLSHLDSVAIACFDDVAHAIADLGFGFVILLGEVGLLLLGAIAFATDP
jgi:hypothetical protein